MQRWQEEVEILEEEFRRTIRSFERMGEIWTALGERSTKQGYAAFAFQKAAMYLDMATDGREKFSIAGGEWPLQLLSQHIYSQRLKLMAC